MQDSSPNQKHPIFRLFASFGTHRKKVWVASLCSVLNKFFDILPEILIGAAVDVVVNREGSFLGRWGLPDLKEQLALLGGLTVLIWICESGFEYAYNILWRNLAQTFQHELRLEAFTKLQNMELSYFEDARTGRLLSVVNDDVNQLERFLDSGANEIIQVATSVLLIGTVFLIMSPSLALLSFLPIPVILIGAFWFQKRIAPSYAEVRERASAINSHMENTLTGIQTVRSFTRESTEIEKVEILSKEYQAANARAISVSSAFVPIIRMAILFGFTATLVYGGFQTFDGTLAVGSYSVLIFLTQRLLWPLTGLAKTADLYERAMASLKRILELIERPQGMADGTSLVTLSPSLSSIRFANVTFAYPSQPKPVFTKLDLTFEAGKTTGLVGTTGAGKSTLIKLLLRFYDAQEGQIIVGEKPIESLQYSNLRSQIGLVNQDVFLFHGTIAENILYGKPGAVLEEAFEAARQAEAHDFINSLPEGYQTIVGERGLKLSGGQRQRITLARALIKNPPILVFDEATSAVDNETEAAIQRSLKKICINRTTIVIAHRLSTIRHADKIMVIENGALVESGTHEELCREGVYAKLWAVQSASGPEAGGVSR